MSVRAHNNRRSTANSRNVVYMKHTCQRNEYAQKENDNTKALCSSYKLFAHFLLLLPNIFLRPLFSGSYSLLYSVLRVR